MRALVVAVMLAASEPDHTVQEWPRWPGFVVMGVGGLGLTGALYLHAMANLCFFGTGCPTNWDYERPAIGVAIAGVVLLLAGAIWAGIAHTHNTEATGPP